MFLDNQNNIITLILILYLYMFTQIFRNNAVAHWLSEVRFRGDTECMNTLQSKSLAISLDQRVTKRQRQEYSQAKNQPIPTERTRNSNFRVDRLKKSAPSGEANTKLSSSYVIRKVQKRAQIVTADFSRLCR